MASIYSIEAINSFKEIGNILKEFKSEIITSKVDNGYLICWLNHEILFGKIQDGNLIFFRNNLPNFDEHLIKLRVFNENKELYIWKNLNGFKYRYRIDQQGETTYDYIDAKQIIWGTKSKKLTEFFSEIKEERGIKFIIPSDWLNGKSLNDNNRLIMKTRNYLSYNNLGQASFTDSRIVNIKLKEGK
ncbi:MAG: type III-D CRISPR-associated protein Csx19 [Promethearchaeota archaeon]